MTKLRFVTGLTAVISGAALVTATAGASGGLATAAASCTPKQNIEAIIDDSGSMSLTDPNTLRVQGLNLLMNTTDNDSKTLGAIQFGTDASSVFAPGKISTNRTAFSQALAQQILADDGSTNYNAAFDLAKTHNPNADERIFLTDGEHNEGDYANGHQGGPRTDVIGLSDAIAGDNETRLQQIASDTGGTYRKVTDAGDLQAAMNSINVAINCGQKPVAYTDTLRQGKAKSHVLKIPRGIHSVQFALSWANPGDKFDIVGFKVVRKGKTVAHIAAKKKRKIKKLKIKRRTGATFQTVKVSKLVSGKLKFKVRARKVTSNTFAGAKLTTQASRSKKK
jgi:hypothetical protein